VIRENIVGVVADGNDNAIGILSSGEYAKRPVDVKELRHEHEEHAADWVDCDLLSVANHVVVEFSVPLEDDMEEGNVQNRELLLVDVTPDHAVVRK
jgi:hypothetical protein